MSTIFYQKGRLSSPPQRRGFPGGTVVKITSRILLVVFALFSAHIPVRADDFSSALDTGKSFGSSSVNAFHPQNLTQTLQNRGVDSTADNISPHIQQGQTNRTQYESFYTDPGGMTAAASSEVGDFVNDSYQTRTQFNLKNDPTVGSGCLQTDGEGKCTMWSRSQEIIGNTYPNCEEVSIPRYDEDPNYQTCEGARHDEILACDVTQPVSVSSEIIYTPCEQAEIDYRPGQVYAVCKDYFDYWKDRTSTQEVFDDCNCENVVGNYWCQNPVSEYTLGAPPSDAITLDRTQLGEVISCRDEGGWDWGTHYVYSWYAKYRHSVVERIFITYNSPCGDLDRLIDNCTLQRLEQCDPNGQNCLVTVDNGEPTGVLASTIYQTHTRGQPLASYDCSTCGSMCTSWIPPVMNEPPFCEAWMYGCNCDISCQVDEYGTNICGSPTSCSPIVSEGCVSGSCSSLSTLVDQPANSAVQVGTGIAYDPGVGVCSDPNATAVAYQNTYYVDPRVCNSFSGSMENYMICMDGEHIQLDNNIKNTALTKSQVREHTAATGLGGLSETHVRIYGGPDIKPVLNGWHMKTTWGCYEGEDNCQALKDQGCTMYERTCSDPADPYCRNVTYTYRCGGTGGILGYEVAVVCDGNIRCMGTECKDASYEANKDFSKMAQVSEIMNALRMDSTNTEIFPGKVQSCQEGPIYCCNANTGGVSVAQYAMAMKSAYTLYSTMTTGIMGASGTAAAMAESVTSTFNLLGQHVGLATVTPMNLGGGATMTTLVSDLGATGVVTQTSAGVTTVSVAPYSIAQPMMYQLATAASVVGVIISAYVVATTVYQMIFACTEEDMVTSISLGFALCHWVGKEKTGNFLGMKLKSENVYCCFNSILARLVHEQGRPQVGRGWGSSEQPDCTGFSIGEFAALDFSQMKLGEYMQYIQTKTNISPAEMEAIQQRAITATGAGGS